MIAMRSNPDPFMNIGDEPEKQPVVFTPRAQPTVDSVRPSAIDLTAGLDEAGNPRRGNVPRLSTQNVLPPLRAAAAADPFKTGDPFKAAGPVFLPPLQRGNGNLQGFPPARNSLGPSGPPRRPTAPNFTLRGPLPSLARPGAKRESTASTLSGGSEAEKPLTGSDV